MLGGLWGSAEVPRPSDWNRRDIGGSTQVSDGRQGTTQRLCDKSDG